MTCTARQFSDQMRCKHGISWDVNDPDVPDCTKQQQCPRVTPAERDHRAEVHGQPYIQKDTRSIPVSGVQTEVHEQLRDIGFTGNPAFGVLCGLYKSNLNGEPVIVSIEWLPEYDQNRMYTYYTTGGRRLFQILSRATKSGTMLRQRYSMGNGWGEWENV